MRKGPKVGLALGGGGARGLAHVGVLRVLEREGIPIDLIVGTSMGALVGAAYAVEADAQALGRRVLRFLERQTQQSPRLKRLQSLDWPESASDVPHKIWHLAKKELFLNLNLLRKSALSEREVEGIVRALLPDIDVRDTRVPYAATAVDLVTGEEVILDRGPLIRAVMASCAVPGFLPPVQHDGRVFVDGGVRGALPIRSARALGSEVVIGVDVRGCLGRPRILEDGIDAIARVTEIMSFYLNGQDKDLADVLIEPPVNEYRWTDFLEFREIIRLGETAAEAKIEAIRARIDQGISKRLLQQARRLLSGFSKDHDQSTTQRPTEVESTDTLRLAG